MPQPWHPHHWVRWQSHGAVQHAVAHHQHEASFRYAPLIRATQFKHPVIKSVASHYEGKTGAQVLIRWALQKGYVSIPKSVNEGRIKENAGVFGWSLSDEDVATLDGMDCDHHECWDPLGWPA